MSKRATEIHYDDGRIIFSSEHLAETLLSDAGFEDSWWIEPIKELESGGRTYLVAKGKNKVTGASLWMLGSAEVKKNDLIIESVWLTYTPLEAVGEVVLFPKVPLGFALGIERYYSRKEMLAYVVEPEKVVFRSLRYSTSQSILSLPAVGEFTARLPIRSKDCDPEFVLAGFLKARFRLPFDVVTAWVGGVNGIPIADGVVFDKLGEDSGVVERRSPILTSEQLVDFCRERSWCGQPLGALPLFRMVKYFLGHMMFYYRTWGPIVREGSPIYPPFFLSKHLVREFPKLQAQKGWEKLVYSPEDHEAIVLRKPTSDELKAYYSVLLETRALLGEPRTTMESQMLALMESIIQDLKYLEAEYYTPL